MLEYMNKKVLIISGIIALVALTYTVSYNMAIRKFNNVISGINERQSMYNKISDIDQIIRQEYIGDIDENMLQEELAKGYINGLYNTDCNYLTPNEYKMYLAEKSGKTIDIGATFVKSLDSNIEITSIFEGSAAANANLKVGDIITKINGKDVSNIGFDKAIKLLQGNNNNKIDIDLYRNNSDIKQFSVTLQISQYQNSHILSRLINNNIGYINILNFANGSANEFYNVFDTLQYQGAQGFIIDLRDTAYGEISNVAELLDKILPAGDLISIVNKTGESKVVYKSGDEEINVPINILINNNTKGAAEIFASAFKDYSKGLIIGEPTAGKAFEIKSFPLSDGSALCIPIANYTTPKSGILTNSGLAPDFIINMSTDDKYKLQRYSLSDESDIQLKEAINKLPIPEKSDSNDNNNLDED